MQSNLKSRGNGSSLSEADNRMTTEAQHNETSTQ